MLSNEADHHYSLHTKPSIEAKHTEFSSNKVATPQASAAQDSPHETVNTAHAEDTDEAFVNFKPFPRLPLELHLLIWNAALPGPHAIRIHSNFNAFIANDDKNVAILSAESRSRAIPTALLHTTQESRSVGLKKFEPFNERWAGNPIYVNFKEDTLSFGDNLAFSWHCGSFWPSHLRKPRAIQVRKWQEKVRHIEIACQDIYDTTFKALHCMKKLETVTVQTIYIAS